MTVVGAGRSAEIILAFARAGPNRAELRWADAAGSPLVAQEVTLTAANPPAGVEPISRPAEAIGPGAWRVPDLLLLPGGTWSIEIEVLINDFEKVVLDTSVEL